MPLCRQPMRILPRWVYFSAFEIRFRIICSSRRGSDRIVREDLTTRSSSFCNWAFGRKSSRIRFSRSLTREIDQLRHNHAASRSD